MRILIADPDPATAKALNLLLQHKLEASNIVEVSDLGSLIRALAEMPPNLLLLDWRLYGSPAPETCVLLRKAYPYLKIILLSVDANDSAAAKGAGAAFIHKGASPGELIATLKPFISEENKSQKESNF